VQDALPLHVQAEEALDKLAGDHSHEPSPIELMRQELHDRMEHEDILGVAHRV